MYLSLPSKISSLYIALLSLCGGCYHFVYSAENIAFPYPIMDLPKAVSNNAVAAVHRDGIDYIISVNGLSVTKLPQDITSEAFVWSSDTQHWRQISSLPGDGKLASTAVTVKQSIYVIGGYTIANNGVEISTPEMYKLSYPYQTFRLETHMPVPVDDTVAVVYQNRYVYLISGWHDAGNISRVQVYDTQLKQWQLATNFPGVPVFGHSAAISRNQIVVVDGVGVVGKIEGKRQFAAIEQTWVGRIDSNNITNIVWKKVPNHSGKGRYRMASFSEPNSHSLVFVGGSDNPYNYNGVGYDGKPSSPAVALLAYNLDKNCWLENHQKIPQIMDLRGLANIQDQHWFIGGMGLNQKILSSARHFQISPLDVLKCENQQ